MELWGGVECTINRVSDRWHSQLALSGHLGRITDLDLIADLGIRTLRYPLLWEMAAASSAKEFDWSWADSRLARLRALDIEPIVGLVHHGSGPRHTSLVDGCFASGLAEYARRVAERFPWVERFTPVNEPLTTARFSGLYGHWYPHSRNERCFAKVLINQCRATVLAMQAIRRSNPNAKLVQTEDLGTTYGTAHMQYQCDFDNERRWLTWDLLCGLLDRTHRMHSYLLSCGIDSGEIAWFSDNPCPPDIVGINHYVTSDRFLDERIGHYPSHSAGGNFKEPYADVEAVRVLSGNYRGFRVLREAWARYRLPVAITEVHLGCSREEQMRWFYQAWRAAHNAVKIGCDVRAVTSWALFGAFNWDTLLTRAGSYEPGAFDVRGPMPRPTAIAGMLRTLSAAKKVRRTAACGLGWWQRPGKVIYGPVKDIAERAYVSNTQPILICGAGGSLGRVLASACAERSLSYFAADRMALDICDPRAVRRVLAQLAPWALINGAGFVDVDAAERQSAQCFRQNTTGASVLMEAARDLDIPFVTFSSDLVFGGASEHPYLESSDTAPLNVYGRSKEAAEKAVLHYRKTLCVRTAAFFGCPERIDFASAALSTMIAGRRFYAANDVVVSPTYVPDLASACLDLMIDEERGVFHLANQGSVSWAQFARMVAEAASVDCGSLQPRGLHELNWAAPRPRFSPLGSERSGVMPTLENAVLRYVRSAAANSFLGCQDRRAVGT